MGEHQRPTRSKETVTDFAASVLQFLPATGPSLRFSALTIPALPRTELYPGCPETIVPVIAGSLADAHNATLPPADADIDDSPNP